jgi:hypothetical protein
MAYYTDIASDKVSIRRQFKISVGLVAAMMVAAFALGFSLPVDRDYQAAAVSDHLDGSFGRLINLNQ